MESNKLKLLYYSVSLNFKVGRIGLDNNLFHISTQMAISESLNQLDRAHKEIAQTWVVRGKTSVETSCKLWGY